MKPLKEVINDQKLYHDDPTINTVHRSALIAPRILGFDTYISFLNHFLIKRGYKSVTLRITPYDVNGDPLDSKSFEINQAIVYTFNLEKINKSKQTSCYEIEFFSANNLFIPFPAVIINHISEHCINSVHSYNRTLNDIRESKKISSVDVKEASFEYLNNEQNTSFIVFQRGFHNNIDKESLEFELISKESSEAVWKSSLEINTRNKSMTSDFIRLDKYFDDLPLCDDKNIYSLKVKQPKQFFFYGRILAGLLSKKDNAISANHSYYDNSCYEEYLDNQESYRTFPFFQGNSNEITIHPVNSPSKGKIIIMANYCSQGKIKSKIICTESYFNQNKIYHFDIDKLVKRYNVSTVKTFSVIFNAEQGYKIPARFSIQLCYGDLKKGLKSSVNNTLCNDLVPTYKKNVYMSWIQVVNHSDYNTYTSICFNDAICKGVQSVEIPIKIKIYSSKGLISEQNINLLPRDSYSIMYNSSLNDPFVWVTAESSIRGGFSLYTFHKHKRTGHSSGEHNF